MKTEQGMDIQSARKLMEELQVQNVKLAVTDCDGVLRGKYVQKKKFDSALKKGFGFCDVIFGWDANDVLYAEDSFTGWQKAFPDAWARIDPDSCRMLPTEDNQSVLFLADFSGDAAAAVCPRSILKKVMDRLSKLGFSALASSEFEFFLFDETPESIREKGYRNLKTLTPGNFGYSVIRNSSHADLYHQIMQMAEDMGMPIEGLHTETGPGVLEAALEHCDALRAADNAILFKTFMKVLAQQNDIMATFMAKWSADYPGQSGHLHMSLIYPDGSSAFYDENNDHHISDSMRWFIGGQQKLMPEFLSMVASSCNSYTRLIPGFWAPTAASWGLDNRTCAIRAIPGTSKSQRIEYRVSAADINPYLALAAAIGSGLWGIENQIEPDKPIEGNAYTKKYAKALMLPSTLSQAAGRLKASGPARDLFGDQFVDHFAYTREWEDQQQQKAITDWQLGRYFEII
ncbi:glutamine synthetase family protein [Fulvivirgaceae bacterium BMA10]|uniref:Glutamine synthetase family protein n=1 Tax=Splendidivirga corallicola TaxID=3051826 RepID=A0ABT8KV68_9BACT|nr:glutamine synthetase family protein [Fulvivirgaceae bacterium BMA10]